MPRMGPFRTYTPARRYRCNGLYLSICTHGRCIKFSYWPIISVEKPVLAPTSLDTSNDMHAWAHKTPFHMGPSRVFSMLLKRIGGGLASLAKLYCMTSNSSPW
jgi:hypothetical protein